MWDGEHNSVDSNSVYEGICRGCWRVGNHTRYTIVSNGSSFDSIGVGVGGADLIGSEFESEAASGGRSRDWPAEDGVGGDAWECDLSWGLGVDGEGAGVGDINSIWA